MIPVTKWITGNLWILHLMLQDTSCNEVQLFSNKVTSKIQETGKKKTWRVSLWYNITCLDMKSTKNLHIHPSSYSCLFKSFVKIIRLLIDFLGAKRPLQSTFLFVRLSLRLYLQYDGYCSSEHLFNRQLQSIYCQNTGPRKY